MSVENWLQLTNILLVAFVGLVGIVTARRLSQVSVTIDGRLSQLLQLTAKASHAEGVEQERAETRKETP